jgi:hypothetical protein
MVWQAVTHLEVIIDDTYYCAMGGDFDHMPLRLRLSINCSFVEPQYMIVTKKFIPKFKYDKSKVEEYQLALIASLGNLWIVDLIGHLGAGGLADLLQQCVGVAASLLLATRLREGAVERNIV